MFTPRLATLLSAIGLFWCLGSCFSATAAPIEPFQNLARPQPVPSFTYEYIDGRIASLPALIKAQPTTKAYLLHLWSPDCPPCRREMKLLHANLGRLSRQGYQVITVAEDPAARTTVPYFLKQYNLSGFAALLDPQRQLFTFLKMEGVPYTYWITPDGRLTSYYAGDIDWSRFDIP